MTSNSAYSGTRFYIKTLKPPYYIGSKYTLQGFIYPVDFEEEVKPAEPKPLKSNEEIAKEVIKGLWG